MLNKVLLVAVALLALPPLASAEVSYTPPGTSIPKISVFGEIRREDLKDFIALARLAREAGTYQVSLDSIGGDVATALAMGRILRRDSVVAYVAPNSTCFSSCVFVLAGAQARRVFGTVGIHRPYVPLDDATTVSAQKLQYQRIEKEVKVFLQEMNIPQELYDHMLRIPPQSMKLLSPDELQRYGLNESDPYADAAGNAAAAKRLGISSQEFIRRLAKANAECNSENVEDNNRCIVRILKDGR